MSTPAQALATAGASRTSACDDFDAECCQLRRRAADQRPDAFAARDELLDDVLP